MQAVCSVAESNVPISSLMEDLSEVTVSKSKTSAHGVEDYENPGQMMCERIKREILNGLGIVLLPWRIHKLYEKSL